jgi:ferric-dicitrate binding protein FerR (iron transport regulator)
MIQLTRCRPFLCAVILRRRLATSFLALLIVGSLAATGFAADRAGHVEKARGKSTGLLEGVTRDLAVGEGVYMQEILQTGSAARLTVALGLSTRLKMGEQARVRISRTLIDNGGELVLARGAIWFDKPEFGNSPGVVVKTPFAVIAARGTSFFVGPSNGVIGVFVERGSVLVENSAGSVTVSSGEGTNLTSETVAPTPPSAWGAPRIASAREAVN